MNNKSLSRSISLLILGCFVAYVFVTFITHMQIANSTKNITTFNQREMTLNKKIFSLATIQKGISYELDKLTTLKNQYSNELITKEKFFQESTEIRNFINSEVVRSYRLYSDMKDVSKNFQGFRGEIISLSVELYIEDFEAFERSFDKLSLIIDDINSGEEFSFENYEQLVALNKKNLNFILNSYQSEFDTILASAETYILEGHKNIFYAEIASLVLFSLILGIIMIKVKSSLILPLLDMKRLVRAIANKKDSHLDLDSLHGEMRELADSLIAMKRKIGIYEQKLINQKTKAKKVKDEQGQLIKDLNHFLKSHIGIVDTVIHDLSHSERLDSKETNLLHLAEKETHSLKEVLDKIEQLYPDNGKDEIFFSRKKIPIRTTVKKILGDFLAKDKYLKKNINLSFNDNIEDEVFVNPEIFENLIGFTLDVMASRSFSEYFQLMFEKIENESKNYLYITMAEVGEHKIENKRIEDKLKDLQMQSNHELNLLKKELELLQGSVFFEEINDKVHLSILVPITFILEKRENIGA